MSKLAFIIRPQINKQSSQIHFQNVNMEKLFIFRHKNSSVLSTNRGICLAGQLTTGFTLHHCVLQEYNFFYLKITKQYSRLFWHIHTVCKIPQHNRLITATTANCNMIICLGLVSETHVFMIFTY